MRDGRLRRASQSVDGSLLSPWSFLAWWRVSYGEKDASVDRLRRMTRQQKEANLMKKTKKTYVVTLTMTRYLDQDLTDARDNEFTGTTEELLHQQLLAEINDCIDEGRLGGILGEPVASVWLDGIGAPADAPHASTGPRLALLAGGKA